MRLGLGEVLNSKSGYGLSLLFFPVFCCVVPFYCVYYTNNFALKLKKQFIKVNVPEKWQLSCLQLYFVLLNLYFS